MKRLVTSKHFDKDLKKFGLSAELIEVINCLLKGETLPAKYKDHALKGDKKIYRDCHIFNDLVLIYRTNETTVELYRLNTHSELFN